MRISTRGQYSLEALLYLAALPEGTVASAREIAESTGISEGYLEQLFIALNKAGIVRAVRGAAGGYRPGRPPADISAGDILRAAEGSLEPVACLASECCPAEAACVVRHTWSQLYREINACVDAVSLADLAADLAAEGDGEYAV